MKNSWVVAKFGGTSMGTIESMKYCAKIVQDKGSNLIIVSATSGTTNLLVELTKLAPLGKWEECQDILAQIKGRHHNMVNEITTNKTVQHKIDQVLKEATALVQGSCLLKECSLKAYDGIVSVGELLSSLIFAEVLKKFIPKDVEWFDSRRVLRTSADHKNARPNILETKACALEVFTSHSKVYLGQGFIGGAPNGATTTLGRGGSDYSAALYAEAVDARLLEIWTDVPGMASTDPRICKEAKSIDQISFKEAAEMATFGAKILHPATLAPAIRKKIPVFVGSTFEPHAKGTIILESVEDRPTVRGVSLKKDQSLITLSNPKMLNASGFLMSIFEVFGKHEVSVDAITTSEISVAMTIDSTITLNDQFVRDLKHLGNVEIENNLCLIAVIGNDLPTTPRLGQHIFEALDGINVRMITHGASSHNFCFLVDDQDSDNSVRRIHKKFL